MKEQTAEELLRAQNILVIGHKDPDGDAIGSILGLSWALRKLGKRAQPACADPVPETYVFLPGSEAIGPFSATDHDLIVTLDGSDATRFGACFDLDRVGHRTVVNIDHHITNTRFASVNWVGDRYAATCEMVFDLLPLFRMQPDARIATCLLTGSLTDTLGFRTSNTTPRLLRTAAQLVEAGAPLAEITDQVFSRRSLKSLQLWGKVIESMQCEGELVWAANTIAMRKACGVNRSATNGVVNLLATTREANIAILFTERDQGQIDVSMRARPGYNVSEVAFQLGGGGHPQAAGCTLAGPLDEIRELVLAQLKASLDGRTGS